MAVEFFWEVFGESEDQEHFTFRSQVLQSLWERRQERTAAQGG